MSERAPLKNLFSKFEFAPTPKLAEQIIKWRLLYENRDTHPDALNTPLLGVYRLGWYPRDSQGLFDILDINKEEFKRAIRFSSIPTSFRVASDEFNLLTVWAAHIFINSNLNKDLKFKVIQSLFFMMLVKFFSSLLRHYLPHMANKGIMELTIDSLTDKFDIKHPETSTWKLIMEKRASELASGDSIHGSTLKTFIPDQKVIYVITDLQTRIRTKVRNVMLVYFDMVKQGRSIEDSDLVGENKEGEKIIKELKTSFDSMIANICNRVLNTQQFIRADFITIATKLVPNVSPEMMRTFLMQFSSMATYQYNKRQTDEVSKDGKYFVGYHALITNLIQRTYRKCIMDKVNLKSRLAILKKAIDLYRSSRINDPIILKVKASIERIVKNARISQRESTNTSLRIAFVVYIIMMSFDCD